MRPALRWISTAGFAALGLAVAHACTSEPAPGAIEKVLRGEAAVEWPLPLRPLADARDACRANFCLAGDALDLVFNRAAEWMVGYDREVRLDAAVGLSQIRRTVDSPNLERAWSKAAALANEAGDHPHRRFWLPEFRLPADQTSRWHIPVDGEDVDLERVVSEALHCKENGWRPETTAYACGSLRDAGGYRSTHALWALSIARDSSCVDDSADACIRQLEEEIAEAQPRIFQPQRTPDVDLYAERLLSLLLSGYDDAEVHGWARELIALQGADGSWAIGREEDAYHRYDATNTASWALAEWLRRLADHPGRAETLGAFRVQDPMPIGGPAFWGCALPESLGRWSFE